MTAPDDPRGYGDPAGPRQGGRSPSSERTGGPDHSAPRGAIRIGRFFGVPLYVSSSWLIIGVAVTVGFADVFRTSVDGADGSTPYLLAFAFAMLSLLSVLGHELGHVIAALALGLRVRRVFIFLLGGVSEIQPEPTRAGQEMAVSAAGPLASAGIGAVAWLGTLATAEHSALGVELRVLVWSNFVIAVFNALPGLPLDGGRVLRAAIWGVTRSRLLGTRIAAWGGRILAALVASAGVLFERGELRLVTVVCAVALGAFLWMGASQSLAAAQMTARLPHLEAGTLARRAIWVRGDLPVDQAIRRLHETGARAIVVIDGADRPVAVVSEARITAVAGPARAWTDVAEVADAAGAVHPIPVGLAGRDLLAACQAHPAGEYVVVDPAGRGVGVLALSDLRAALLNSGRNQAALT